MFHVNAEQVQELMLMLAAVADRNGGALEVTQAELDNVAEKYGFPLPMVLGRDEGGLFGQLFRLEDLAEQGWPAIARTMRLDEATARYVAQTMQSGMQAARALQDRYEARHREAETQEARARNASRN